MKFYDTLGLGKYQILMGISINEYDNGSLNTTLNRALTIKMCPIRHI